MTIIDDDLIERCAKAAFEATVADGGPHRAQWEEVSEVWRCQFRRHARVILAEALQPAPADAGVFHVAGETGPLPGQEVLL